jgi:hypothetical protein
MLFLPKRANIDDIHFRINDTYIDIVDSYKYLGYVIDSRLSSKQTVRDVCSRMSTGIAVLSRCRSFLPHGVILLLSNSIILPHLYYSHFKTAFSTKADFMRLEASYNNVGKVIFSCVKRDLCDLDWLDIRQRLLFANIYFIFNIVHHSHAPPLLNTLLPINKKYNTRNAHSFTHPRVSKRATTIAFSYWVPRLWDSLPLTIK